MKMRMAQMQVQVDPVETTGSVDLAEKIVGKKAQIEDAVKWRDNLRDLNPTPNEMFNASNYIVLLRGDLEKLERRNENGKA
jgi:hypothetical protein